MRLRIKILRFYCQYEKIKFMYHQNSQFFFHMPPLLNIISSKCFLFFVITLNIYIDPQKVLNNIKTRPLATKQFAQLRRKKLRKKSEPPTKLKTFFRCLQNQWSQALSCWPQQNNNKTATRKTADQLIKVMISKYDRELHSVGLLAICNFFFFFWERERETEIFSSNLHHCSKTVKHAYEEFQRARER